MAIDKTIVKKVGKLAKIKIEQSEKKKLIQELNNILDWVDELKQVGQKGNLIWDFFFFFDYFDRALVKYRI